MRILGIETSCDETALCIIDAEGDFDSADFRFRILGNALLSQTVHSHYGGVFPNLAKREHEKNLVPLLEKALGDAGILVSGSSSADVDMILPRENDLRPLVAEFLSKYGKPDIDAIAVTHGPGLEPALWVGVNFAKALAAAWNLPIVPVNHMEGHIVISATKDERLGEMKFPFVSLLISGGHTELVLSREWMQYELLGQTRDDAVGEAFDKVARLIGLPYPGGPEIDRLADEARAEQTKVPQDISLPRPMIDSGDYDFSFSGLKTAVRKVVEANEPLSDDFKKALAREFQEACGDVLAAKTMRAIEEGSAQALVVGGGVSASRFLREHIAAAVEKSGLDTTLLIPPRQNATDNALMIALAGYFRAQKGDYVAPEDIRANGNLKLAD